MNEIFLSERFPVKNSKTGWVSRKNWAVRLEDDDTDVIILYGAKNKWDIEKYLKKKDWWTN